VCVGGWVHLHAGTIDRLTPSLAICLAVYLFDLRISLSFSLSLVLSLVLSPALFLDNNSKPIEWERRNIESMLR